MAGAAVDLPVVTDGNLPADIQWMPPGAHTINASRGGYPATLGVNVNEEGARNAQAAFESIMDLVSKNEEDRPYIDLNHNDEEASAWPSGFFWGGDDPIKGGIRMKISEWSDAGKRAVIGKTYRRFSPCFYPDENGIIVGIPVNCGGLVNRAAFRKMQPVWSKSSAEDEDPAPQRDAAPNRKTEEENTMKSLMAVLARLGLITSADASEADAVAQVSAKFGELSNAKTNAETELTQTKAKLTTTEGQLTEAKKLHATAVVEAAVQAGRVPSQNEEVKAKWIGLIQADPANASLLPEPNPAVAAGQVVKPGAISASAAQPGPGAEHPFMVKAKALQTEKKISLEGAFTEVAASEPKLYDEYRESLGK